MPALRLPLDVVPDSDDPWCATIWVQVYLGETPVTFGLDSGARRSQVLEDIAHQWPVVSMESSTTVFGHQWDPVVTAPRLRLGELDIVGLEVTRIAGSAPGTHNLLGLDVLRQHSCLLDLEEQLLILDGRPDAGRFGELMPLHLDGVGHAYLDVVVGDDVVQAVWDTGAGITVVDTGLIERCPEQFEEIPPSVGVDAVGRSQQTPRYLLSSVTIGGMAFAEQHVAAVDLGAANATLDRPMDMILGYPALRQAAWFIDFPGRQWSLSARIDA